MFNSALLPFTVAAALLVYKLLTVPDNSKESCPGPLVLLQERPPTLPTHFIVSMSLNLGRIKGPVCRDKLTLLYLCSLLLAESYAPEPNPGPRPPKFPCAVCHKACKWTTPCVCCDTCECWYHQECMGMNDAVFKALTNCSWECVQCGVPNFSTGIFDTTLLESNNSFNNLTIASESEISFSCPNATSSPQRRLSSTTENSKSKRTDLPLRILLVNCQSIKATGKRGQLEHMIESTQADVIIGTESWLDDSIKSSEVFPSNFKSYRRDRQTDKQGGGVFILVSDAYDSEEPPEITLQEDCEVVWCKVKVKGSQHLYIGSFYKPPSQSNPEYLDHLDRALGRIPRGAHLWLGGDFNLPDIDWPNECTKENSTNTKQCQQLIQITRDHFLEQMVNTSTRITSYSSNLLDLFFTNNSTLVNKCDTLPGIGDHEAVFIESSLRPMKQRKPARKVHLYKNANFAQIKQDLDKFFETFTLSTLKLDANDSWRLFEEKLKELMDKYIPSKMVSGNKVNKPWVNKLVKSNLRKLKKLHKKQKSTMKKCDREKYEKARSHTQKIERQQYWKYIEGLIEDQTDDDNQRPGKQKRFWNYIRSRKKDNCGISPLKDNGKLYNDPMDKATILNKQYKSVFTHEDLSFIPKPDGDPFPTMPDIVVETQGIVKLIKQLNPQKASGPDMLPARLLKELANECAPFLCTIYRKCLTTGEIPEVWKTANVTAIFKKGERFKASNYRPVSLTCICCKILEHVIVSNMMTHFDNFNILADSQHGFRRKRSCETQLLTLVNELTAGLDKGKQFDLAVLDFSKAFDRVPHARLLSKLDHYGIRGNTLAWIKAFLSSRTQRVTVEGATSEPEPVVSGVPQGSVLGPILFLAFINDLPQHVSSKTRLFADDCIVYRQIDTPADSVALEEDLGKLAVWERKWGMSFHPEKCNILRVHRKRKPYIHNYTLKGHVLTVDSVTKYLGVHLTENLSWNTHINKICKKANNTLGFLRRNLRISNESVKSNAYITLVRPHLEYCCTIWNPYTTNLTYKLEMVQRRAARYATNRYHNTSSVTSMIDHLGWDTLEARRKKAQLTMFFRIINNLVDIREDDHLTRAKLNTRSAHSLKYRPISTSTAYYRNSFFPRTITTWNNLPASVAEAPDLVSFKRGLSGLSI